MSFRLILRPEAEADASEAWRWYSVDELERTLNSIQSNPDL